MSGPFKYGPPGILIILYWSSIPIMYSLTHYTTNRLTILPDPDNHMDTCLPQLWEEGRQASLLSTHSPLFVSFMLNFSNEVFRFEINHSKLEIIFHQRNPIFVIRTNHLHSCKNPLAIFIQFMVLTVLPSGNWSAEMRTLV